MQLNKLTEKLLFVPLGGSGEIGMNLNLYHYKGKWIMVDCGTGFAEERIMPGVDIIVPDISFIIDNKIKIEAIIITHAHEDHVGAVPHLWEYCSDAPVYATPFTAHFLKTKLTDFGLQDKVKIKVVTQNRAKFKIADFNIEMIGLTHSIPEMRAIYIKTDAGNILHTGDFKIDKTPIVGEVSDEERLKQIGDEGVMAVVCDSTNVFSDGWSGSEGDIEDNLVELIQDAKQCVVVTTFASNVARVQTIANAAKRCGRQIILSGTSLHRISGIAKKVGYLDGVSFVDAKDFDDKNRHKTLIIATGCQGEPLATVAKLSGGTHPFLKIKNGDKVIFSSKIIPGNEKKIAATLNRLADMGVEIVTERNAKIHVSGHPNRDELKHLYELVRPAIAIPVHGEAIHINEHCKWAKSDCGVKNTISVRNGHVLCFENGNSIKKIGEVAADYLGVEGNLFHSPGGEVMKMRRRMKGGVIMCSFALNGKGGIACSPRIVAMGSLDSENEKDFIKEMEQKVAKNLKEKAPAFFAAKNKTKLHSEITNLAKGTLAQMVKRELKTTPMIEIMMMLV